MSFKANLLRCLIIVILGMCLFHAPRTFAGALGLVTGAPSSSPAHPPTTNGANGPNGTNNPKTSCQQYSSHPLRYSDGEIKLVEEDLPDPLGTKWFGHTRSYNNALQGLATGQQGYGWLVQQWPYCCQSTQMPGVIIVVLPPTQVYFFYPAGGGVYTSVPYADRVTLTDDDAGSFHLNRSARI